jgi:hypothetical protein
MSRKYSIMVRENGADHERELAQVDSNPQAIVEAARELTRPVNEGGRKFRINRYEHVYALDNATGEKVTC